MLLRELLKKFINNLVMTINQKKKTLINELVSNSAQMRVELLIIWIRIIK